jgi:hypothetical protein
LEGARGGYSAFFGKRNQKKVEKERKFRKMYVE